MNIELAAAAARNGGPFTRAQALRAGHSAYEIRSNLRDKQWTTLRRGIYVESALLKATLEDTGRQHALDVAAAGLTLGVGDAAGSHYSAARIYGLSFLHEPGPGVILTRPHGRDRRSTGLDVHVANLPDHHRRVWFGVAITSPARTVVDLSRGLPFRDAVVLADSALRSTATHAHDIREVVATCAGWRGVAQASQVVEFADPRAESALESVGRVFFAERRLPPPQTQVLLSDSRGPIGRVDFYWPEFNTVDEADGLQKYATPQTLTAEKLRQERLEEAGYEVVRLTWHQVFKVPEPTAARFRAAFARGRDNR